jgi:hypothetical protein
MTMSVVCVTISWLLGSGGQIKYEVICLTVTLVWAGAQLVSHIHFASSVDGNFSFVMICSHGALFYLYF